MKYTASRLSDGNKIFPSTITIEGHSVTLKIPGLFKGTEQTIPMDRITSVDIETPFVGFSTIKIYSSGWDLITASGFTKAEVKEMKATILTGQRDANKPQTKVIVEKHFTQNKPTETPNKVEAPKLNKIKWAEELAELKELLNDNVITSDDFEEQKLKIMGSISLDGDLKLSDCLRELKGLQETGIITEAEFNILKQNLMNK